MNISIEEFTKLDEDDYFEEFAIIDHRSCEDEVIDAIAEFVEEPLEHIWKNDEEELWVKYQDQEYKLPLTITRHDRYVAISSLAELLKDEYTFWIDKETSQDDTHSILVLNKTKSKELEEAYSDFTAKNLEKLELGVDYFSGLKIPYLGNEDNNPNFREEAKELDAALVEYKEEITKFFENDKDIQKAMKQMRRELGTDGLSKFKYFIRRYGLLILFSSWLIYKYLI